MPNVLPTAPLSELLVTHDGAFTVPDGWQQGRGAYGGLIIGAMVRAMETSLADPERRLQSVTAELPAPTLPGPTEVRVEFLRAGNAVTTLTCRMLQDGHVTAHAVGVFGKARSRDADTLAMEAPKPPDWRSIEPLEMEPPLAPYFTRYFEYRLVGAVPFTGATEGTASGFVRPRNSGPLRDAAWVVACADAYWPALFARLEAPRPMATVAFTLQLLVSPTELPTEAPLFHRGKDLATSGGYSAELRELWHDGRLVALNQQTMAVIK